MSKWSRSDVIGLLGLVMAMGSFCLALVVVPEFRQLLGLDRSPTTPAAVPRSSPIVRPGVIPMPVVSSQSSPRSIEANPASSVLTKPLASPSGPGAMPQSSPLLVYPGVIRKPIVSPQLSPRSTEANPALRVPTKPLETTFRRSLSSAPASWCQSVKDSRQFCEVNDICIESKETHLLRLKENGC